MATRQVVEVLLVVADGVHVQQPLGGVGVAAVAGVDHVDVVAPGGAQVLGEQVGRRGGVAHHEHVGLHGDRLSTVSSRVSPLLGGRGRRR
jgi:hypothetical protein